MEKTPDSLKISMVYDRAVNYASQQNFIPVVKELLFCNDSTPRKNLTIRIATEPGFAEPVEMRLEAIDAGGEYRLAPLDMKLRPNFLAGLNEKVSGLLRAEVVDGDTVICAQTEPISLLAHNQWGGLAPLPEILAAFILPNDPAVTTILGRAAEVLREHTGRSALNGYQDRSHKSAWDQVAAIYKAVGELGVRYIVPPASFEKSGQKIRLPSDIIAQRFGTCLDLSLLFSACCEQAGLNPLVMMHEGHAYAGCWLEARTLPDPSSDDIQHIRKLSTDELITAYECTSVTGGSPGTLRDAEMAARPHLQGGKPFRLALDVRQSRAAGIKPMPILGQRADSAQSGLGNQPIPDLGLGDREFAEPLENLPQPPAEAGTRVDKWKSRLLDLSLRNRLLNFRETSSTVCLLSPSPQDVECKLATGRELSLRPKPKIMGDEDPRSATVYSQQQHADAKRDHLVEEINAGYLHTHLDEPEHGRRLTKIFRSARNAIEENGSNTLFAAIGLLEWRETEQSDRTHRAPLLLVPVELKRRSAGEGFSLRRMDEETLLNVTLLEKLRQDFQMEIPRLDPPPLRKDQDGVDVEQVLRIFREAVRDVRGWEIKDEIWLGQFSFTKFLLYKDLADRLEDLTRNRVVNHLINHAEMPYPNPAGDIRPEQLDDECHPRDTLCPLSADSSQLAAVMAAADGHDFVLEGPPGTGKSQTITNMIAQCLAQGKSVLFVAEKRAALDVVYRRLKEVELDPFCLELHSNKVGKAEVVAQFDRSLRFLSDGGAADWERQTLELQRLRDSLNRYAIALHRRYECGLSAFRCIDYLLPRQGESYARLDASPSILNTPLEVVTRAREVAKLLQQRSGRLAPLADHPLALLACEDCPDRVREKVLRLSALARSAAGISRETRDWLRCPVGPVSRADSANLLALVDSLLAPEPVGPAFVAAQWDKLSAKLDAWISLTRRRGELRADLAKIHKRMVPGGAPLACEAWPSEVAADIYTQCEQIGGVIQRAIGATNSLCDWIGFPRAAATRADIANLVALAESLLAPSPVGERFAIEPWEEWVGNLDQWIGWIRERTDLRARLAEYDESKLLALNIPRLTRRWHVAQNTRPLLKWLRIASIRRGLRMATLNRTRPEIATLGEVIRTASLLRAVNEKLASVAPQAEALLGSAWNLGEPRLDQLCQVRGWGATLHQRLAALAGDDTAWLSRLRALVAKLFRQGVATYSIGTPSGDRLDGFRDAIAKFDAAYDPLLRSAALHRDRLDSAAHFFSSVASAFGLFQQYVPELRVTTNELNLAAAEAQDSLGDLWAQGEPSAAVILRAQAWGKLLHSRIVACAGEDSVWLGNLRGFLASLFREGPAVCAKGTAAGNRLLRYRDAHLEFNAALDDMAAETGLRREGLDTAPDYFSAVHGLSESIANAWPQMRAWCLWQQARNEGTRLGLGPIIADLESAGGTSVDVPQLFERSFQRAVLNAIVESEPILRLFSGDEHGDLIEHFRGADERIADLTRSLIRARLAARIPGDNAAGDAPVAAELGLLRREIARKRGHLPVRQLLGRIPKLLPRLKPCVLMSPLSVAQFLDPSHTAFDVVIFDEASQVPVWDAIGAMARGKQIVVVGDPKQLPPTNFFKGEIDDEDIPAPDEFRGLESILDELMAHGLRHKRLRWHYRSRHEGLIAFSNRQYYENELLTFPSAETALGGVRFKHLPGARYDKGGSRTNRVEAEALVKELIERLRSPDGMSHSYGVVTFSLAQQQLVENLLDEERRKYPEVEVHFNDDPPFEGEPVFVKNLENVQGDERDVIYFSICYGPDETGRVAMSFGPLNRNGGERRLNVAITRAKHEVVVFSGLRADQIDLTRTRARGVRDLKYFLDYAERGQIALAAATSASASADPDSEFVQMVASQLRSAGYAVNHQVGCSGYRIDLGILDPNNPGRYLLGVECDGAAYHRAATARDRDKLRQLILEGLGWRLYRIWSTDWWHDCGAETRKLLAFIDGLLKGAGM